MIHTKAITHITANRRNVATSPIASINERKVALTMNAAPQLTAAQTATALPRTWLGKISEIIVQTTGPRENANDAM